MTIQADHKDIKTLIMRDASQFHIPIYQRSYTWEAKNEVKKLLDDILEFGEEYCDNTRADYYIGNLIIKNQNRGMTPERVVIDGQQRITTTILMLCAIREIYEKDVKSIEATRQAKTISRALYEEDEDELKLKLNNMEFQSTLSTILTGPNNSIIAKDRATTYWKNYSYLLLRLRQLNGEEFNNFVEVLSRVKVVVISLDEEQDENSVFESINSLGKRLSGSDLIKNYLFTFKKYKCSHNEEKNLIDLYTRSFESLFRNEKNMEDELEKFFREYIALKTQVLVRKDPKVVYYAFKEYIGEINSLEECREWMTDIVTWGVIYQTLRVDNHHSFEDQYLEYLRATFGTYASLLMDITNRYSNVEDGALVVHDSVRLNAALKAVVAYDAARLLAGSPVKEITRFIPTVRSKISAMEEKFSQDYAEAFRQLVTTTSEGYKQQSLQYLLRSVLERDLYNSKRKQILRFLVLLENIGKKESLSFERGLKGCEVEHIMPQTLNDSWNHISGDAHEKYLHTLGNLSITFDNQGLSNKGFQQKKKFLLEKSRIKLNNLLSDIDVFDEKAIKARAIHLVHIFAKEYGLDDVEKQHESPENTDDFHLLEHPKVSPVSRREKSGLEIQLEHNGINSCGILNGKKVRVLEGSEAALREQPSLQDNLREKRDELLLQGVLVEDHECLRFSKDYEFGSTSMAAGIITGSSVNGRLKWQDLQGRTLRELNL